MSGQGYRWKARNANGASEDAASDEEVWIGP